MERRIRLIAHLLWSGNVGGIERLVCDLAAEQVREGLEVTVAFGQANGPFVAEVAEAGARVIDLGIVSGRDVRPRRMGRGAALLREVDVLHLHGFNLPMALIAIRSGLPIVYTEHGNFALGRSLGLTGRAKRGLQARFLRRCVKAIGANSSHTADVLSRIYGIDRETVTVVHNGFAFVGHVAGGNSHGGELVRIAFVGRLVSFKRVDRLIKALSGANQIDKLHLNIIGGGPLEPDLRLLVRALGLEQRVSFLGYRNDVSELLAEVDLLVLPSENEPFGLAVLEACANGVLPIVFSDGGGVLETMPPDGIVVESVERLASLLDALVGSDELSDDARRRRVNWVREQFPISATASRYLELYREAAGSRV
jgi:glycosyltransferase involved in cell wall biosynthesis